MIHSFILAPSLDEGDILCPALYVRRLIHYLHTTLVVDDGKGIGTLIPLQIMITTPDGITR